MTTRYELLILPQESRSEARRRALIELFVAELPQGQSLTLAAGTQEVVLVYQGDAPRVVREGDAWSVEDDNWPRTPSFRVSGDSQGWKLESDPYAFCPLYRGEDGAGQTVVSTRPEPVAAACGAGISLQNLLQDILVTYLLDDATLFEGVLRVRPGERWTYHDQRGFQVEAGDPTAYRRGIRSRAEDRSWIEVVARETAECFAAGGVQELTGGIDSRLVMALGVHAGQPPLRAMTLGPEDGEDVQLARQLCALYGTEHIHVTIDTRERDLVEDGETFTARGGFASLNASSYSLMPARLEALRDREVQVGGLGGECAMGFYHTPFDRLTGSRALQATWIRKRMFHIGPEHLAFVPGSAANAAYQAAQDKIAELFRSAEGSWRRRSDTYYLEQRMRTWSGAVLRACESWYRSFHPLMLPAHIEWAAGLPDAERMTRLKQMELIESLAPKAIQVPFSENRRYARTAAQRVGAKLAQGAGTASKVWRRLSGSRAKAASARPTGLPELLQDPRVVAAIHGLAEELPGLNAEAVLSARGRLANLSVGPVLTAAWARQSLQRYREVLA